MAKVVLRLPKVKFRTGLSRSTIYRRIAEGTFPKAIQLGSSRSVGWLESDIENWIDTQIGTSTDSSTKPAVSRRRLRKKTRRIVSKS